jgi:hypothetical protein
MRKSVSKLAVSNNPKEKLIYNTISRALDFNASGENAFIKDLSDKNNQKFNILKSIMQDELNKNEALDKELTLIENRKRSMKDFSPLQKLNSNAIKVSTDVYKSAPNPLLLSLEKNQ